MSKKCFFWTWPAISQVSDSETWRMHHFTDFRSSNKLFSHHEIQLVLPLPSSEDAAQRIQVGGGGGPWEFCYPNTLNV